MLIEFRAADLETLVAVDRKFAQAPYGSCFATEEGLEIQSRTLAAINALDASVVFAFVASNLVSVGVGVLTNWIYDRLKDRDVELRIDGKPVLLSRADIEAAIQKALDEGR